MQCTVVEDGVFLLAEVTTFFLNSHQRNSQQVVSLLPLPPDAVVGLVTC